MSKLLTDHLTTVTPGPLKSGGVLCSSSPREVRIETSDSSLIADDPALLIGLALACVRQEVALAGVPLPILVRLAAHACHGNHAARLVLDWLTSRLARNGFRPGSETARSDSVRQGRKPPRERVMEELARPVPEDLRPRGRTRHREPVEGSALPASVGSHVISKTEVRNG